MKNTSFAVESVKVGDAARAEIRRARIEEAKRREREVHERIEWLWRHVLFADRCADGSVKRSVGSESPPDASWEDVQFLLNQLRRRTDMVQKARNQRKQIRSLGRKLYIQGLVLGDQKRIIKALQQRLTDNNLSASTRL